MKPEKAFCQKNSLVKSLNKAATVDGSSASSPNRAKKL